MYILTESEARWSLFTEEQRAKFYATEKKLVEKARRGTLQDGSFAPLLKFWEEKRNLFLHGVNKRGFTARKEKA